MSGTFVCVELLVNRPSFDAFLVPVTLRGFYLPI
jgi:hypothetical protein